MDASSSQSRALQLLCCVLTESSLLGTVCFSVSVLSMPCSLPFQLLLAPIAAYALIAIEIELFY